mgnify:CR=1 FL=1
MKYSMFKFFFLVTNIGTTRNNITIHLSNIFEKELSENSVCKEFLHTRHYL